MAENASSKFPSLKSFGRLNGLSKPNEKTSFFDCKFYPYTAPGVDPIFAVAGGQDIAICRPPKPGSDGVEIIAWFRDADEGASLNSVAWTYDHANGHPQLCVTGENAVINVFDVFTREIVKSLVGHGKDINDLAISPQSPWILASASLDASLRIWSLDPEHSKQPCMLICAGEGHREGLNSLAYHQNGKYILTGGMDNVVNVWSIPSLPNEATGTLKPTLLHYPHFSTNAIHTNVVDSIAFHKDLIVSRCAEENVIKIWYIDNFDSTIDPPSRAPTTHEFRPTRSAWGGGYQVIFQLKTPGTDLIWMRFSISPTQHPILALGDTFSKIRFWDLQALEDESDDETMRPLNQKVANGKSGRLQNGHRFPSVTSESSGITKRSKDRVSLRDPFKPLASHTDTTIPKVNFAARQISWSPGGEWMVVVGDQGMIAVFGR